MIILVTPTTCGFDAKPASPYTSALLQHDTVAAEAHFDSLDALVSELEEEMDDQQVPMLRAGLDVLISVSEDRFNELMEA